MLPWMLRTPVSSTVKCRRKSHRIAYIIYAQKKKQRTKNWSLWNSKTDFKKFRQNSITWNILHLVCEIGFKPAIWYSSYSKCHIFLNKISWSNDELCQELSWSQCAITEKNQIEEGGGGWEWVRIWNFHGFWRNNKWIFKGLIISNMEFPRVIKKNSHAISTDVGFMP